MNSISSREYKLLLLWFLEIALKKHHSSSALFYSILQQQPPDRTTFTMHQGTIN